MKNNGLIKLLNTEIKPIDWRDETSLDVILNKVGDTRLVLMGEATHGTMDFYQTRMALSKRLIAEKNFHAIAIEGEWTSAFFIHQFLQGQNGLKEPKEALRGFNRFPLWMWRNMPMIDFLQWLRQHNDNVKSPQKKIGFFGLDLYCLNASMEAVIQYLKKHDPASAEKAIHNYACFEQPMIDPQMYGYMVESRYQKACVNEVCNQFLEMQNIAINKIKKESSPDEALFYAVQNARLVKNAEHYYRALFEARAITWNIRDEHMMETVHNLLTFLESKHQEPAKIIIWAHNSHIGDARATEMSDRNEINLGQLVRERFHAASFHLGFSTHHGTVTASDDWDGETLCKTVNPGMAGSYEELFHKLKYKDFFLSLHENEALNKLLKISRLQRAIGVIYRPETELESHYFFTKLPYQFDGIIHLDETKAIEPLD